MNESPANGAAKTFLVLALLFGTLSALLTPPFQVPDEPAHFFRAVSVSHGRLSADANGAFLPAWSVDLARRQLGKFSEDPSARTSRAQIVASAPAEYDEAAIFVPGGKPGVACRLCYTASSYTPLPYAASAVALSLSRRLQLPPLTGFYAGRIANLLLATALIVAAILIAPFGKWLLALLALSPMSVHLMASYSADSLTIASAFLLFSMSVRSWFKLEGRFNPASVHLPVSGAVFALCKPTLILLLPLLVPLRRARTSAAALTLYAGTIVAALSAASWWSARPLENMLISPTQQFWGIVRNPLAFANVLGRTWIDYSPRYFEELVGKLGWMDVHLPAPILLGFYVLILYACRVERSPLNGAQRLMLVVTFAMSALLVFLTIYLTWNRVEAPLIDGVQGRYFIPLSPLLAFAITRPSATAAARTSHGHALLLICCSTAILIGSTYAVLARYYFVW